MGLCVVLVEFSLVLLVSKPCGISVSLLLRHLKVSLFVRDLHLLSLLFVSCLCLLKQLGEMILLLEESIVSGPLLLLEELLLANLLGSPVSLL